MTRLLDRLAHSAAFTETTKFEQAALLVWAINLNSGNPVSLAEINEAFDFLGFPKANTTRLKAGLTKSRSVRAGGKNVYLPTNDFAKACNEKFPNDRLHIEEQSALTIVIPPFVQGAALDNLKVMLELYQLLFLLENSIRGFVEERLSRKYGDNWWDTVSNSGMRSKHQTRMTNESTNKWAPSRSEFGPLYSVDWPDLLAIIRKEHSSCHIPRDCRLAS